MPSERKQAAPALEMERVRLLLVLLLRHSVLLRTLLAAEGLLALRILQKAVEGEADDCEEADDEEAEQRAREPHPPGQHVHRRRLRHAAARRQPPGRYRCTKVQEYNNYRYVHTDTLEKICQVVVRGL